MGSLTSSREIHDTELELNESVSLDGTGSSHSRFFSGNAFWLMPKLGLGLILSSPFITPNGLPSTSVNTRFHFGHEVFMPDAGNESDKFRLNTELTTHLLSYNNPDAIVADLAIILNELAIFPNSVDKSSLNFDKITIQTVEHSKKFIEKYFYLILNSNLEWLSPHLSTEGDGGVSFEWLKKEKILTIFVSPKGAVESLKTWGPNIWDDMEEIKEPTDATLLSLWSWFLA